MSGHLTVTRRGRGTGEAAEMDLLCESHLIIQSVGASASSSDNILWRENFVFLRLCLDFGIFVYVKS